MNRTDEKEERPYQHRIDIFYINFNDRIMHEKPSLKMYFIFVGLCYRLFCFQDYSRIFDNVIKAIKSYYLYCVIDVKTPRYY